MKTVKIIVEIPEKLAHDIDALIGGEERGNFLVQCAEKELKRRRLLTFLRSHEQAWKDEDHPELVELGTNEWVRQLRKESSVRFLEDTTNSLSG
jgi:hypothetical protein